MFPKSLISFALDELELSFVQEARRRAETGTPNPVFMILFKLISVGFRG